MTNDFISEVEADMEHDLLELLKQGEVFLTFQKLDGSIRDMRATVNRDLFDSPPSKPLSGTKLRGHQRGLVTLWDLDNNGYRSFHIKHLISFYTKD